MANKRKELNISGVNLWYLVGLITSDGCLSGDGRHIDITAKEYNFLIMLKEQLGLINKVCIKNKNKPNQAYHIQIANSNFYDFLSSVGLTPAKSLTLGALKIPCRYFVDFLRGLTDGDGCIRRWIHPTNKREQWSLRIYSGSIKFLEWLKQTIQDLLRVNGRIHVHNWRRGCRVLKFGKIAAKEIVRRCYYKNCFGLERKIKLANECLSSYVGWNKSKTVFV